MASRRDLTERCLRSGLMGRRDFLALLGAGAAGLLTGGLYATADSVRQRKSNIILILADDLGYGDLGCQGGRDIPTPNIDSLARNGVRFTNGYVSCPVCSPTRAGLMTGRYQQRFGHEFNPGPAATAGPEFGLPLSQITIADVLKRAGYSTGLVGKWHLGYLPQFHPQRRGFDEFFGFLGGSHSYVDATGDRQNLILRGTEPVDEKEYLTDAFTREAVAFIERHHSEPFFLYLAYNAVHGPLQATPKYLERFTGIADQRRRTYAAMLSAMDDGIGSVMRKLRERGLYRDTLVLFFNDNGGPPTANASSNGALRGAKATVFEGGVRVPVIIQWPRRLKAGQTYDRPVISLDVFPTAAAAAGGAAPRDRVIDGVNLMPYLTGERLDAPHKTLFWRFGEQRAVRKDDWKLVRMGDAPPQLYDLAKDVGESNDLASRDPGVAQDLGAALADWESQLEAPRWGRAGRAAPARPRARQRARARAARQLRGTTP
jgi:arylsulfatase A-like enzyme